MVYDRNKMVEQAKSWIGCKESDGSHKKIIDVYNSHEPLARDYRVKYTDSWCATFVSACSIKCGYTKIIPTECSCNEMITLFKAIDRWEESDAYIPSPGDIIFYDWDDTGSGDNKGWSDHVGIVERISGKTIVVIEGNYNNSVKRRALKVNGKYIRGYGVPLYTEEKQGQTATTAAQSKLDSLAGTYTTTASYLNMRNGPGTYYSVMTVLPRGTKVQNYGYYTNVAGLKWLYVRATYEGITYTGFCSSKYLKK